MGKSKIIASQVFREGKALEGAAKFKEAAEQYVLILNQNPLHVEAGNRLMMMYRKLKEYKKEVSLINKLVAAHEKEVEGNQREWIKNHGELAELSRPLAESLGLLNSEGLPFYENEMLNRWKKRREILSKKITPKR